MCPRGVTGASLLRSGVFRFLMLAAIAYNVFVGFTYAYDKWQAKRGGRRVPENTLLLMALLFGAPGALAGMRGTRHKTRKPAFSVGVPLMLVLQVLVLVLAARTR